MTKRILKAYERYDYDGRVVPGSLVLRDRKPKNGNWRELTGYECCNYTTTTQPPVLRLTFNNIENANSLVGDASSVTDWNTFFDLPTYGNPFTSVVISGNEVNLYGGSDITLQSNIFDSVTSLIEIVDSLSCIIGANNNCFTSCSGLTTINLPGLTTAGDYCFDITNNVTYFNLPNLNFAGTQCFGDDTSSSTTLLTSLSLPSLVIAGDYCFFGFTSLQTLNLPALTTIGSSGMEECYNLTSINLPSCIALGPTFGDDNVFSLISSNNITLTVPAALMTVDAGNPDGDIVYLQANNTVTVITV